MENLIKLLDSRKPRVKEEHLEKVEETLSARFPN